MGSIESDYQLNIVLIGSGNLAFSLAHAISNSPHKLLEITSRNAASAQLLASATGASFVDTIENLYPGADVYILSIPDRAIAKAVQLLPNRAGIIVHTSGSTPLEAISQYTSSQCGVFYPFQTFSLGRLVSFSGIPLCIEASDRGTLTTLFALASSLGANPLEMASEMRQWLHLSGVFACNFVNHMLAISHLVTTENGIDPGLLKPLILETIHKALQGNPADSQTGPAARGDSETLKRHYVMLSYADEELRDLYLTLSSSIERLNQYEK